MLPWRPVRRLRQLINIAGRELEVHPASLIAFNIAIKEVNTSKDTDEVSWRVVYRSEAVTASPNPEWRPLPPGLCPIASDTGNATEISITLHSIALKDISNIDAAYRIKRPEVLPSAEDDQMASPSSPAPNRAVIGSFQISMGSLVSLGTNLASPEVPQLSNCLLLEFSNGEYYAYPTPPFLQLPPGSPRRVTESTPGERLSPLTNVENGNESIASSSQDDQGFDAGLHTSSHGATEGVFNGVADQGERKEEEEEELGNRPQSPTKLALLGSSLQRPVTVEELKKQIAALLALRTRVEKLTARCQSLQHRVYEGLADREPAQRQARELATAEKEAVDLRWQQGVVSQRIKEAHALAAATQRAALVSSQALVAALQALQSANKRITTAEAALYGNDGRGRLAAALRQLISRRCVMALQAGQVYRVGPTTVNIFRPPPGGLLDAQLEYHWTGVAGDSMEKESQSGVLLQQEDDSAGSLVQAFSGGSAADGHGSALCQKEVRMTVGGITLTPAVWKHAFDPEGYEWDPAEDKAAAVALGYVAHLVDKLACYLGVPLRYPIQTRGSTSAVLDKYPPAGTWTPLEASGSLYGASKSRIAVDFFFGGRGGGAASSSSATGTGTGALLASARDMGASTSASPPPLVDPVEYPLYCSFNRDRPKFAVAVFLLNKDVIQLLQAHGVSSCGPNQLLQNVHKLIACAGSAAPPGASGIFRF